MATTAIVDGRIVRRTKRMPRRRADSFARMLQHNSRLPLTGIEVVIEGDYGTVEFCPTGNLQKRLIDEQQQRRLAKVPDVKRYKWRRIGTRAWHCTSSEDNHYSIFLDAPKCTCPDWSRMHALDKKCKHFLAAELGEANWQRDHTGESNGAR